LEDRPDRIEAELFPFKFQNVNIENLLSELSTGEEPFIIRYEVDSKRYIQIINFEKHQHPHIKEQKSTIPAPDKHGAKTILARLIPPSPFPHTDSPIPHTDSRKDKGIELASPTPQISKKKKSQPVPFWKEAIEHMKTTWERKKPGAVFMFGGKEGSLLKPKMRAYMAWGIMSLWDTYLREQNDWYREHGYDVTTFCGAVGYLVDSPSWKTQAKKYEEQLNKPSDEGARLVAEAINSIGSKMNGSVISQIRKQEAAKEGLVI